MDDNPYASPRTEDSKAATRRVREWLADMGTISLVPALVSSACLVIAAAHVRADHTNRIPVVTSVGPLAGHITEITYAALGLSFVALILASVVMQQANRSMASATIALLLSVANIVFTIIFAGSIYED